MRLVELNNNKKLCAKIKMRAELTNFCNDAFISSNLIISGPKFEHSIYELCCVGSKESCRCGKKKNSVDFRLLSFF